MQQSPTAIEAQQAAIAEVLFPEIERYSEELKNHRAVEVLIANANKREDPETLRIAIRRHAHIEHLTYKAHEMARIFEASKAHRTENKQTEMQQRLFAGAEFHNGRAWQAVNLAHKLDGEPEEMPEVWLETADNLETASVRFEDLGLKVAANSLKSAADKRRRLHADHESAALAR